MRQAAIVTVASVGLEVLLPGLFGTIAGAVAMFVLMKRFFDADLMAYFIVVLLMNGLGFALAYVIETVLSAIA